MTTVTNMWDLAKDLADMTGSGFPVDARGIDYANTALRVLHNALVNAGADYFRSEQSVSVVADTETYALNSDFMRALKVFYEVSDRRYPVEKWHLDDLGGYRTAPLQSGTIKLWYAPKPTVFTVVGSTLAAVYPVGAEDFIAYHMAVQLVRRRQAFNYARGLMEDRNMILQSVLDGIEPRDEESDEIADRMGRWEPSRQLYVAAERREYRYRIMGTNLHVTEAEWRGV